MQYLLVDKCIEFARSSRSSDIFLLILMPIVFVSFPMGLVAISTPFISDELKVNILINRQYMKKNFLIKKISKKY